MSGCSDVGMLRRFGLLVAGGLGVRMPLGLDGLASG